MRQMHEMRVELDDNDNEMCIDEQNKLDSSALHKQLYLNKNCKLVPAEDDPMETDIKPSHHVSLVTKDITPESTGLNNQHGCHGFSLPTESGSRESVGYPTKVVSSSNKMPCSEAGPLSANAGSNVFKHMKHAQLKILSLEKSEALARGEIISPNSLKLLKQPFCLNMKQHFYNCLSLIIVPYFSKL